MTQTKILGILVGLLMITSFIFIVQSTKASEEITIKTGTYYGMCYGYCKRQAEVTPTEVVKEVSAWNEENEEFPTKTEKLPFTKERWEKLVSLIEWEKFNSLPDVIGAPDSADEGGEWVEITMNGKTKRVEFSSGETIPEIDNLVKELREIRD